MEKENIFLAEEKKIGEGKGGKFLEKENLDKIQKNSSFFWEHSPCQWTMEG